MKSKKVLIVEDDIDILETIQVILKSVGYKVIGFAKGKGALDHILRLQPDAVILDICLPDAKGDEIAVKLKANKRTRRIPVILISALENLRQITHRSHADAYINKPFGVDDLLVKVDNLVS